MMVYVAITHLIKSFRWRESPDSCLLMACFPASIYHSISIFKQIFNVTKLKYWWYLDIDVFESQYRINIKCLNMINHHDISLSLYEMFIGRWADITQESGDSRERWKDKEIFKEFSVLILTRNQEPVTHLNIFTITASRSRRMMAPLRINAQ